MYLSIYYKRSFFSVVIRWKSPSLIWQGAFFLLPISFLAPYFLPFLSSNVVFYETYW